MLEDERLDGFDEDGLLEDDELLEERADGLDDDDSLEDDRLLEERAEGFEEDDDLLRLDDFEDDEDDFPPDDDGALPGEDDVLVSPFGIPVSQCRRTASMIVGGMWCAEESGALQREWPCLLFCVLGTWRCSR